MTEKKIVVESGACYTFTATQGKSNLVLHTSEGDIELEFSLKNNTLNVSGVGGSFIVRDCSVENATIVMVTLKNWHKQFPSPSTLPAEGAMHNIMLPLDACGLKPVK